MPRQNPWNRFFEDTELKKAILMDVERTSDDVAFFQLTRTHRLMLQILFVYAKEHPQLGYRQGMHEVGGDGVVSWPTRCALELLKLIAPL
jgi:TBC1 domain family protein 5